jgi:hypothetical protein
VLANTADEPLGAIEIAAAGVRSVRGAAAQRSFPSRRKAASRGSNRSSNRSSRAVFRAGSSLPC